MSQRCLGPWLLLIRWPVGGGGRLLDGFFVQFFAICDEPAEFRKQAVGYRQGFAALEAVVTRAAVDLCAFSRLALFSASDAM